MLSLELELERDETILPFGNVGGRCGDATAAAAGMVPPPGPENGRRTGRSAWLAAPPPAIAEAQRTIVWAEHLVIIYPLWLGSMPALLKGFLEQALRPPS